MNQGYNRATHFSIVWAVTLAILTMVEWRNLEQDPLERQILSPFIQRDITVSMAQTAAGDEFDTREADAQNALQYEVAFHFNGPLFLLCFFGPILLFHGIARLWSRLGKSGSASGQ